jgi:short chain dehydrogenase
MNEHPRPPFSSQQQPMPGHTEAMQPKPDHGERSYRGSGKLSGKRAIITGADSGIGRAVAIAFAREGADVLISYLKEHDDAKETQRLVEETGRKAVLLAGDIQSAAHCHKIIEIARERLGGLAGPTQGAEFTLANAMGRRREVLVRQPRRPHLVTMRGPKNLSR